MFLEIIICYLIGAFSPGYILAKRFHDIDLRYCGSGSTGATNALRCTKNKYIAAVTLLTDVLKGVIIALMFKNDPYCFAYCLAGLVGHTYPCWLKFHGGRGVSTSAGMFLVVNPLCALIAVTAWILTLVFIKISAVASLVLGFTFLISTVVYSGGHKDIIFALTIFLFILWTHRLHLKELIYKK